MNDLEKRCETICEKSAYRCFTPGGNRFECLSDMLTDKMRAVREVIENDHPFIHTLFHGERGQRAVQALGPRAPVV